MKVYAVVEAWDNCEDYEDRECTETLIGIASTPEIAERLISERMEELMDIAKKANTKENPVSWEEIADSISHELSFVHDGGNPFHTYSHHEDYFYWRIQEKELVMK